MINFNFYKFAASEDLKKSTVNVLLKILSVSLFIDIEFSFKND